MTNTNRIAQLQGQIKQAEAEIAAGNGNPEHWRWWIDQADKQKEKNKLDAILLGQECAKTEIGTNFGTKERTTA